MEQKHTCQDHQREVRLDFWCYSTAVVSANTSTETPTSSKMKNYKQQRRGKKGSKNWIYGAHLRLNELKFRDIFRATNLQVGELLEDPVGCADPLLESPEGLGTEIVLVGGEGEFRGWISWESEQFRRRDGYGRWGLSHGGWMGTPAVAMDPRNDVPQLLSRTEQRKG